MSALDIITIALLTVGVFFFFAGSVGILRLPDVFTRLHAITKADNLGLGFTVAALMLRSPSLLAAAKIMLIWVLVLIASATASHLIAQTARLNGVKPWRRS